MLFADRCAYADKRRADGERYFVDEHSEQIEFPSLSDRHTVELSVIVPAYNEQYRCESDRSTNTPAQVLTVSHLCLVRPMLDSCLEWLTVSKRSSFEVIVVSDGSTDATCDVVMEYVHKYGADRVRLLKLIKNRGKGGAVCLVSERQLLLLLLFEHFFSSKYVACRECRVHVDVNYYSPMLMVLQRLKTYRN